MTVSRMHFVTNEHHRSGPRDTQHILGATPPCNESWEPCARRLGRPSQRPCARGMIGSSVRAAVAAERGASAWVYIALPATKCTPACRKNKGKTQRVKGVLLFF